MHDGNANVDTHVIDRDNTPHFDAFMGAHLRTSGASACAERPGRLRSVVLHIASSCLREIGGDASVHLCT